ncbi:MAG TPA: gephyrin-like molybdotransferase Glp [Acidobacteriaceae bacterium]|nr:gephyrin-like molybdotransferase Glp [Acidobacteriaceae bacterium]
MSVVEFAEALDIVLEHARGFPARTAEQIALLDAAGRVLAEDVTADRDQPPFHRSTRDGFAVRATDFTASAQLKIVGQVRAGEAWCSDAMQPGCAIEIMTGAPMPDGADAVAMIEHVALADGNVWAAPGRTLRAGENVVPQGSEARAGEVVLAAGSVIGAAEIAMSAACGHAELMVRSRPSVTIIATGDELVELGARLGSQQIWNSNGYALAALVAVAGGRAERSKIARDTREDIRARIAEGRRSDLLLLSGGVSAGKYDLVEEALAEFGAEFFFTGVKMQPGRPVVFGRLPGLDGEQATYFFGLPGNPVSTQVTFHCFVEPLLRAMCGAEPVGPKFVQGTLAEDVSAKAGLTRVLPTILRHDLERPELRLVSWQGSGDLGANARANCYAVLPDGEALHAGDVVTVLLR